LGEGQPLVATLSLYQHVYSNVCEHSRNNIILWA
jgi:hypothetical protein